MPLNAGFKVGPYEIITRLGAGGMGEVYRAHDSRLGRDLAIKILAPGLVTDTDAVARFEREARAASALNHPHILHIYDIGEATEASTGAFRYIAMEFVDGSTLADRLHAGSDSLRQRVEWLLQIAEALTKAHDAGIVHRDLKPANIMISADGYVKVLDFGLAKLLHSNLDEPEGATAIRSPKSGAGVVLGTVGYMAPEQAEGRQTDSRSDVFSLGCIAYETLSGQRAFGGTSKVDVLHSIIHDDPPPLDSVASGLPPELVRIVRKCLTKRALDRYQTARDLATDLRNLLREIDSEKRIVGSPSARSTSSPQSSPHSSQRGQVVSTIAVLPFDDLSPERDNEYFSVGLSDEIISDLSGIGALRVIARGSVMRYSGAEKNIREIAGALGCDHILDGSVRKAGDQLRITAQLIDAEDESQVWAGKFRGTLDEIFEIQENVSTAVVAALRLHITDQEKNKLGERPIDDAGAYELYLRARHEIHKQDGSSINTGLTMIDRAMEVVGENAVLLGARGYGLWSIYNGGIRHEESILDDVERIARRVFEIAPDSHHGYRLMGLVDVHRQRIPDALRNFREALRRDPNDIDSLLWNTITLASTNQLSVARRTADKALKMDPFSPLAHVMKAVTEVLSGRFEAAVELNRKAYALAPNSFWGFFLAQTLALAGQAEEASTLCADVTSAWPSEPFAGFARLLQAALAGDRDAVLNLVTEDVREMAAGDLQYASWLAEFYSMVGEVDLGLEWLDRSISRGFLPWQFFGEWDPFLANLRGDPRFDSLIDRAREEADALQLVSD